MSGMMSPTVTNTNTGTVKAVKNLGWLLRHANEISMIFIHSRVADPEGCEMTVALPGLIYHTTWASREVCRQWLQRPSMRNLPVEGLTL